MLSEVQSGFTKGYCALQLHHKSSLYSPRVLGNYSGDTFYTWVWTDETIIQRALHEMAINYDKYAIDWNNCCSIIQINIDSTCIISDSVKLRYHDIGEDGYHCISGYK
jgi:hypothetical protein